MDGPVRPAGSRLQVSEVLKKKIAQQAPRLKSHPDGALCSVMPVFAVTKK
jgi:hypothetical protein